MSGREKQAKSSGRYWRREASAGSVQTKGSGRRSQEPRSRDVRGRSGDCGSATSHLPADRSAAAPGSAAAAASTPLACDREGRLVLTARGDWQAPPPLRSRGSPRGFGPTNPHRGGVCPSAKNGMCSVARSLPSPAGPGTRRGCARQCAHPQALRVHFRKFRKETKAA